MREGSQRNGVHGHNGHSAATCYPAGFSGCICETMQLIRGVSMRIVGYGHGLFAVAMAGLAILSLLYRDFAPIWHPLPLWFPWPQTVTLGTGLLLIAASAGTCFARTALPGTCVIGAYLTAWVLVRASQVAYQPFAVASWYGFCEALAPWLATCILFARLPATAPGSNPPLPVDGRAVRAARVLFGFSCVVFGLAHFAFAEYTAGMVPRWLPGPLQIAYITGFFHLAAGIGLSLGVLPRLAVTLEASMMSMFGLLVWLPSLIARPAPKWATPLQNQWSEIVVTLLLAASAWIVAESLRNRPWGIAGK